MGLRGGWVIEVRASFPAEVRGATEAEQRATLKDIAGDGSAPAMAFLAAVSSVKGP